MAGGFWSPAVVFLSAAVRSSFARRVVDRFAAFVLACASLRPHVGDDRENGARAMDLFGCMATYDYGEVHVFRDQASSLRAIVAIHDTRLGPALGGCRFLHYE